MDCAGLLTLNLILLAKACDHIGVDDIVTDLGELETSRFVFVDYDTDELFVRSRMRDLGVVKSPNYRTNALRAARLVQSVKLRREVAVELRRWGRPDADELAELLNGSGTLSEPFRNPNTNTPPPSQTHSQTPRARASDRPICKKHAENHDGPCPACQRRREWDEAHADELKTNELERKRAAKEAATRLRENCPRCHGLGTYEDASGGVHTCQPHQEAL